LGASTNFGMTITIIINRIGIMLEKAGRKNKWLAEKMGVSEDTVSRWVTNKQQPRLGDLYAISFYLECDITDLLISTKEWKKTTKK
jgi:DNA-binding Xre family transcriptional regulator